jgi:hypothetical protein
VYCADGAGLSKGEYAVTFPTSVIRKLAPSEEMFAQSQTYMGGTVHLNGPVDVDAMFVAFDTLLQAHPVFAGRFERGPDGLHHIVVDDFFPPGIRVVEKGDQPSIQMRLDQAVSLAYLRVKHADGRTEVTLYTHHSLTDGQHHMGLVWELFSCYTDMVCTGDIEPVDPQPAPDSLEVILEKRGVRKQSRSGFERLLPALYAYELPPSTRDTAGGNPAFPTLIPSARCQLTEQETQDLITFTRDRKLSLNAVIGAAMLLAEWQVRGTPHIPVPYLYIADLRLHLTPPVDPTAATNPLGVATYLAEIKPNTDIGDLATDIVEAFRADLSDGVIQQSLLHYNLHYAGSPPGLPEPVMASHMGEMPSLRTPPNVSLDGVKTNLLAANAAGVDFYFSATVDGRLQIERHSHMPGPERAVTAIHSLLSSLPSENDWAAE